MTILTELPLVPDHAIDGEFHRIVDELTRRGFLTGGLGLAAAMGLAACSADTPGSPATTSGPWSFTDDLGRKVSLPRRPARIAATDDLLAAALLKAGVKLHASPLLTDGLFPALGLPEAGITRITGAGGEFNVEAFAAVKPDLIVDFIENGKPAVITTTPALGRLAPVAALQVNNATLDEIIGSARRFAAAVRDPAAAGQAPDAAAKSSYDKAIAALKAVTKAKPGVRAAFVIPTKDNLFISRAKNTPYMSTLAAAGVTFIADHSKTGDYFQTVSWENVASLPVDVLIPAVTVKDTSPTWERMPAVAARQVFAGKPDRWSGYFYQNYAGLISEFTAFLRTTTVVAAA